MADDIVFGTDGWRARIGDGFTFANLRRVAAAAAAYYGECADAANRGLIIGHDCRFLAREFAQAAAEVVVAHGIPVLLTPGPTPTPVTSYAVVSQGAAGAINITASHNPPGDLGFKVRDASGAALAPEALRAIEDRIPAQERDVERMPIGDAIRSGKLRIFDPALDYRAYVARQVDLVTLAAAGLRVAYDPMWGAGIGWLTWLLGPGAKTTIQAIHNEPNPTFPGLKRPEPIPPNTDGLARFVREIGADVGIANDGDADRIGLVDEHGQFINQLQTYGLLAYYLLVIRGERRPIVRTLSTTSMLDVLGAQYGVPVHETGVGFKHVGPKMAETDAMIGGEESGGFAFRPLPERDGLVAALAFLDLMHRTGLTPSQLVAELYRTVGAEWLYRRRDLWFPAEQREAIRSRLDAARPAHLAGLPVERIDHTDGYKFWLPDRQWLLIRFSGTEPLLRVYVETTRADLVEALLAAGVELAGLAAEA